MNLYADSSYPVRKDIAEVHASQLGKLGMPGTWGTGAQRLAVAAETRKACYEAGILETPTVTEIENDANLPDVACEVIRLLAVSPKDVDKASFDSALKGGLSNTEYVEIVGLVARLVNLDVFARGIGVPPRQLPSAEKGEPSRERPEAAIQELAWVPTIPNPPEGGQTADELYGGQAKPYIVRGLSLVPDEVRAHLELEEVQYLPLRHILKPNYQHHDGLTRSQVEIVAGRVSALNECFF
jgi:hypothetical protein